MSFAIEPLNWLIFGGILMLAELIIPGGIVVFIGAGALSVAASLQLGLVETWVSAFTQWFITSLILLIAFRNITQKLVGGDTRIDNTDEELDAYGSEAKVVESIGPGQQKGRIEFQGTTWSALGDGSLIEAGQLVKVICRDNISIVVKPIKNSTQQAHSNSPNIRA